jgi:hypothetical protein
LKNPITSSGFEPAAFWLVAECLNQLRYLKEKDHLESINIDGTIIPGERKCTYKVTFAAHLDF